MGYQIREGTLRFDRPGGALAAVCDVHGQPASAQPDAAVTIAAGARAGDVVVLATADGYVGLRVRAPR